MHSYELWVCTKLITSILDKWSGDFQWRTIVSLAARRMWMMTQRRWKEILSIPMLRSANSGAGGMWILVTSTIILNTSFQKKDILVQDHSNWYRFPNSLQFLQHRGDACGSNACICEGVIYYPRLNLYERSHKLEECVAWRLEDRAVFHWVSVNVRPMSLSHFAIGCILVNNNLSHIRLLKRVIPLVVRVLFVRNTYTFFGIDLWRWWLWVTRVYW